MDSVDVGCVVIESMGRHVGRLLGTFITGIVIGGVGTAVVTNWDKLKKKKDDKTTTGYTGYYSR